jgi:hypothetical protein
MVQTHSILGQRIRELLATPIQFASDAENALLSGKFNVIKGDHELTEAVINGSV